MNSAAKILVPLLMIVAVIAGAMYLLQEDAVAVPPVRETPPIQAQDPPTDTPPPVVAQSAAVTEPRVDHQRTDLRTEDLATSGSNLPQGVSGRVLTPAGAPFAGALVYLMRSTSSDAIDIFLRRKRGEVIQPLATAKTDEQGNFRVGTSRPDQTYDVRIVTEDYPELHHRSVRIKEEDWYDTGDLFLENGVVVQGRVIEEGTMVPVSGALVYLNSTNAAHTLLATPGREKGLVAEADAGGFFRYNNAPRDSTVSLAAEAPGYARVERLNLLLKTSEVNEFDVALGRGLSIVGVVVDTRDRPIAGARVVATAISSKLPQTAQADTDREGRFTLVALRDNAFQLVVSADNHEEKTEKPVLAGAADVVVKLQQSGMAKVMVLAKNGSPVRDFTVSLKRSFPNNPIGIGNVTEFRDLRVTPRDFDGEFYTVKGIPNGDFVFQIVANRHAKTLSAPFTVVAGGNVPEVVIAMTMGGTITGRVLDDRGGPVSGATVATDMDGGFAADTDFGKLFAQFLPDRVTKTSVRTDANGVFTVPLLAFGEYMLRVNHSDFCESFATSLKLESDAKVQVPDIYLKRGALVYGVATVNGQPMGQVKVSIGPPQGQAPETEPTGKAKMMFMATAITDSDGSYRFLKRVPPGTYQIHASRQAGSNDIFGALLEMRQTARDLMVMGQQEIVQNFALTSQ